MQDGTDLSWVDTLCSMRNMSWGLGAGCGSRYTGLALQVAIVIRLPEGHNFDW